MLRSPSRSRSDHGHQASVELLAVGLGNPGTEYEGTRHNIGAAVVALLAARHDSRLKRGRQRALVAEASVDGRRLALAFPQTFMNDSGAAVAALVRRYGVVDDLSRLVVVHDELDLPPGTVKLKFGGGVAGHNGLESVRTHLRTGDFLRVRIGVGKPPTAGQGANFVLRRPTKTERSELDVAMEVAADAVEAVLAEGTQAAMNRFNTPR